MGGESDVAVTTTPMSLSHMEKMAEAFGEKLVVYLPAAAEATAVLILGCGFIKCFVGFLRRRLVPHRKEDGEESDDEDEEGGYEEDVLKMKEALDPTLVTFLLSIADALLKLLLGIVVCGMVGIKTTSIIAIFTASTLAVGLALKGLLTDLANGVMIIIFRPFVLGDWVHIAGKEGIVTEISMFRTLLTTENNKKTIIIPNSHIEIVEVTNGANINVVIHHPNDKSDRDRR